MLYVPSRKYRELVVSLYLPVIILFLLPGHSVQAQNQSCFSLGYTILTINGVFTDEDGAKRNNDNLRRQLPQVFKSEPVTIDYLHNPSHLAGFGDITKSILQGLYDDENGVSDDYDFREMLRDASEKVKTQKVLLVAHSQGNFYANSIYTAVAGKDGGVPVGSIGVYSVATPTSWVAGGGRWITSDNDTVIAKVVKEAKFIGGIMAPNVSIEKNENDPSGHSFSETYLKYEGGRIVSDIKTALEKLETRGDGEGKCIDPVELSFFHKATGLMFTLADPTAEGAVKVASVTTKAVYKTGEVVTETGTKAVTAIGSGVMKTAEVSAKVAHKTGRAVLGAVSGAGKLLFSVLEDVDPETLVASSAVATDSSDKVSSSVVAQNTSQNIGDSGAVSGENVEGLFNSREVDNSRGDEEEVSAVAEAGGENGRIVLDSQNNPPALADSSFSPQSQDLKEVAVVFSGLSGGSGGGSRKGESSLTVEDVTDKESSETKPPESPSVTEPADFSEVFTDGILIFSGVAEGATTVSNSFNSETSIVSESGIWSLTLSFEDGEHDISFFATDESDNVSDPTTVSFSVDSQSPEVSIYIPACESSLAEDGCLLTDTEVYIHWTSTGDDVTHYFLNIDGEVSSTEATSTVASLSDGGSHSVSVSAEDGAGNMSTTSAMEVSVFTSPVVINEVAWMGTEDNSRHEWLELYNNTPFSINLSGWSIRAVSDDLEIELSGEIAPMSHFVLGRMANATDETGPFSDVAPDMLYGNGASQWSLSNGGGKLELNFNDVTFDSTPDADSGWTAGENAGKLSMERRNSFLSGADSENWGNNLEIIRRGKDAEGNSVNGTPGVKNSVSYLINKGEHIAGEVRVAASEGPYLIAKDQVVLSGAVFQAEEGTVIKFAPGASLYLSGKFISGGTKESPVVLTSIFDDESGGDTNGDGDTSPDAVKPWKFLVYKEAEDSVLSHIALKWGEGIEFLNGGYFTATDISVSDSENALVVAGPTEVSVSEFFAERIENEAVLVYDGGSLVLSEAVFSDIMQEDVIVAYEGSSLHFEDGEIKNIADNAALALYSSDAEIYRVYFAGGLGSGIEVYNEDGGTLLLEDIKAENFSGTAIEVYGGVVEIKDSEITLNDIGVEIYDGETEISNSEISYSNVGISIYGGKLSVEQSDISGNGIGAEVYGGQVLISGSEFFANETAVYSATDEPVEAKNNDWGDLSGPKHETDNPAGLGDVVFGNVLFIPWAGMAEEEETEKEEGTEDGDEEGSEGEDGKKGEEDEDEEAEEDGEEGEDDEGDSDGE
ncbi:MAG: lamin tail domain-containing protein [bacterium]|nr:lamin tail domain-containing protein [bacterium]